MSYIYDYTSTYDITYEHMFCYLDDSKKYILQVDDDTKQFYVVDDFCDDYYYTVVHLQVDNHLFTTLYELVNGSLYGQYIFHYIYNELTHFFDYKDYKIYQYQIDALSDKTYTDWLTYLQKYVNV